MTIKDTLANLDTVLGVPPMKLVTMTKAEFETHVTNELVKAKADAEEDDTEKKTKAKKRLEHLRAVTKLLVMKSSWEGGNDGALPIPVYEEGFEPPTYLPTEEGGNMTGGAGTQGDGQSAFANSGPTYDQPTAPMTNAGTKVPGSGSGTQADGASAFANSGPTYDQPSAAMKSALDGLSTLVKGLAPAAAPIAKAAPIATGHVDDPSVWPKDLANPAFMKEGIAKRAEEWGTDPWAAKK